MSTEPRQLHLKVRVIVTEPMTVGTMRSKVRRTLRTGIVQRGIDIAWVNWRRLGDAGHAKGGTYLDDEALEALREFYGLIHHEDTKTRIEVVSN